MSSKRIYGSGSFREIAKGKFELRYHGKSKTVEVANEKSANRALVDWVDEIDAQEQAGPEVSMRKLFEAHLADLRRQKRKDILTVEQRINKHLNEFGKLDASKIKKIDIKAYIDGRIDTGAEAGTINRELSIIRRSLNIGLEDEWLTKVPVVKSLKENAARQGFVEYAEYRAMLGELAAHAQMPWVFSYYTGMRRGELLKLEWDWMDWTRSVIVIPEQLNKNGRRRYIPVYDEMVAFIKIGYQGRDLKCRYLFQRDGKRIVSVRTAIENAARRIGKPNLLFHDLRRTGVRNMERAGIPRTIARQVSGHLTESVYIRYAIGAEKDALEVGERMAVFHQQEREKEKLWDKLWGGNADQGKEKGPEDLAKFKQ